MKRYLKLRWKETMIACIFFALNVFSVTASSFMFMKTIDAVTGGDRAMIWRFLLYQVLLWAAAALTYYVAWIWKGKTDKGIANDMRRDISALLMKKSYQQFEEKEIGEYLSWYSNDVAQLNIVGCQSLFFTGNLYFADRDVGGGAVYGSLGLVGGGLVGICPFAGSFRRLEEKHPEKSGCYIGGV